MRECYIVEPKGCCTRTTKVPLAGMTRNKGAVPMRTLGRLPLHSPLGRRFDLGAVRPLTPLTISTQHRNNGFCDPSAILNIPWRLLLPERQSQWPASRRPIRRQRCRILGSCALGGTRASRMGSPARDHSCNGGKRDRHVRAQAGGSWRGPFQLRLAEVRSGELIGSCDPLSSIADISWVLTGDAAQA